MLTIPDLLTHGTFKAVTGKGFYRVSYELHAPMARMADVEDASEILADGIGIVTTDTGHFQHVMWRVGSGEAAALADVLYCPATENHPREEVLAAWSRCIDQIGSPLADRQKVCKILSGMNVAFPRIPLK